MLTGRITNGHGDDPDGFCAAVQLAKGSEVHGRRPPLGCGWMQTDGGGRLIDRRMRLAMRVCDVTHV